MPDHKQVPLQVWVDIDEGIADMVAYLNTIDGVRTHASCQGTIGEGGPAPYRAQVLVGWSCHEAYERLHAEFDMSLEGWTWTEASGCCYVHPREGWTRPARNDSRAVTDTDGVHRVKPTADDPDPYNAIDQVSG